MDTAVTLTKDTRAIVQAHATRQGATVEAALEDLVRRGAAQFDWREIREGVEDVRATVMDTFASIDAMAPYAIASLQLLAHWAARSNQSGPDEITYAKEARAVGRATWEGHLAENGITSTAVAAADLATSLT